MDVDSAPGWKPTFRRRPLQLETHAAAAVLLMLDFIRRTQCENDSTGARE
jgi:hypothetical protein